MRKPLVSVVVPCFNAEKTLKKTLLSVAAEMEKYPDYEVIIVDDGSTDKTPDIVEQFEQWDHRYKGVKQENRGVSAARNRGIQVAAGEYIAFLDADDFFLKDSVSERMKVLIEDDEPNLLGVFCPAALIDMDGKVLCSTRSFDYRLPGDRLYFSFSPDSVFNPSCVIVKKRALIMVGGFDETISSAEDYDLWHKMLRTGGYFKKVATCSIGWRQHSMSACHTRILRHYKHCKTVTQRIFSEPSYESAEEFAAGFGQSLYFLSITKRAFAASIMAVVSRQYDDALKISADIRKTMLEQIMPEELEGMVRFNVLRALSRSEEEWHSYVWPNYQNEILNFFEELNNRFGGDCNGLYLLINRLKNMKGDMLACTTRRSDNER